MTQLAAIGLPVLPLLVLLVALLCGRYPGHEAIFRLSQRIASRSRRRTTGTLRPRSPRPPRSFAPGGGLLIALSLAQRPPPLPA